MGKMNVCVIMGGMSGEHEVSVVSANSVMNAMDKEKYNIIKVGISKSGIWYLIDENDLKNINEKGYVYELDNSKVIYGLGNFISIRDLNDVTNDNLKYIIENVDIFFPVLHGPNAEDGTVQGVFEQMNMPYVGCSVLASSAAMDKIVAKNIFRQANIPVVDDVSVMRTELSDMEAVIEKIESKFDYPVFIKPANMGSSVGVNKAKDTMELIESLKEAAVYDSRILVEKSINAREIECAILGHEEFFVSTPGEIEPAKEFYDYDDKYIDNNSKSFIPAKIDENMMKKIQSLAVDAFKAINGSGLSRIDFFIDKDTNELYLNEINTLPGFTSISMYPKLMEYSGIKYSDLIDKLIELGFKKYEDKNKNKVSK